MIGVLQYSTEDAENLRELLKETHVLAQTAPCGAGWVLRFLGNSSNYIRRIAILVTVIAIIITMVSIAVQEWET